MKIRVRAIIVKDGELLLIHRIKRGREYWVFPGGGVETTDVSNEAALQREAWEELGVKVEVIRLVYDLSGPLGGEEQREMFYECVIISGMLGTGAGPEFQTDTHYEGMYALEWIPMDELKSYNVQPELVKDFLVVGGSDENPNAERT